MTQYLDTPDWVSEEGYATLNSGYLLENETPNQMYKRLAEGGVKQLRDSGLKARMFDSYLQKIVPVTTPAIETVLIDAIESDLYTLFSNGWLSPASPVASNFNTPVEADRGLPVSCFGSVPYNSIDGIFTTAHELAMLSKHGGGTSVSLDNLIGLSPVTSWAQVYDKVADTVNQGGVRRGAVAQYINIDHRDIDLILDARDKTRGDQTQKLKCNIGVTITDEFMNKLLSGDKRSGELFAKVLKLRLQTGSPYIVFIDTANRLRPLDYMRLGLSIVASNLCSEIFQPSDAQHSFTCVLSSMNVDKYNQWKKFIGKSGFSAVELATIFLDGVCQEFIDKASKLPGFENSVRSAIKGRALGLGYMGLHSYYQSKGWSFNSSEAMTANIEIAQHIRNRTISGSEWLASKLGSPEWCKDGSGHRNIVKIAIAPTLTNSVLCNAGSAGVEPIHSNYYIYSGAKGTFVRKNKHLQSYLSARGLDTAQIWDSIQKANGSIQHIEQIPPIVKKVFLTAHELDQFVVIQQASDRQKFIDQGQSLNLFIPHDADAAYIAKLHIEAWRKELKSLYYVRSNNELNNRRPTTLKEEKPDWVINYRPDCPWCHKAEALLKHFGFEPTMVVQKTGRVPQIYKNGELIGGYSDLYEQYKEAYIGDLSADLEQSKGYMGGHVSDPDCAACDG